MLASVFAPDTTVSTDRSMQSQPWPHGAMRSRATIRSIASDSYAATAATPALQLPLSWRPAGASFDITRLEYPYSTSCMDGDLDHDGTEASDAPTTCWRGSNDDCGPSTTSGSCSRHFDDASLQLVLVFQLKLKFETADPKPPMCM